MPVPTDAHPPRRELLREDAYRRLRDAIVTGTLEPGEQLRDVELGRWLGVSRTPVREAISRLERSGLVVTRPGRSTTVSPLDLDVACEAQEVVASMHQLAARLAAPRLHDADLEEMEAANRRFAAAIQQGDVEGALTADDHLHGVLVRAAGNRALRQVLEQYTPVLRRVERLRFASVPGRDSVRLHADLIASCHRGDGDTAAEVSWDTWQTLRPLVEADHDDG